MKWLIYGILAAILFGLWGLFDKLSANINPFVSNIVLYSAALAIVIIMLLFARKFSFSKYGFISGIFAGIGNFFVLFALLKSQLILVLPFVSLAGAAFFILIYLTEKPKYSKKQKFLSFIGIILSIVGIFVISSGTAGIVNFLKSFAFDYSYILPAIFILTGFTLWTYFTYKSVGKEKISAINYSFWTVLGSFVAVLLAGVILKPDALATLAEFTFSSYQYPIFGGVCVALGAFFTYSAFKATTTKTRLQEAIVAILANGELIPLLFLSYFILGEWVPEGFIGTIIVLLGLVLIHYAEVSK